MPKSTSKPPMPPWPSYPVGSPFHLHALGVVVVNYNRLEFIFDALLRVYSGLSEKPHAFLFSSLNLGAQMRWFALCVEQREKRTALKRELDYFMQGFNRCAANRNTLMHANVDHAKTTFQTLSLSKRAKKEPHRLNKFNLKLEDIRRVADEISATYDFGAELFMGIVETDAASFRRGQAPLSFRKKLRRPLPGRPSLPIDLNPQRHATPRASSRRPNALRK